MLLESENKDRSVSEGIDKRSVEFQLQLVPLLCCTVAGMTSNTNNKITSTQQFVCSYKAFVNDAPANPVEADMATDHGQSYCTSELTNGVWFVHVTLSGCAQAGLHS